MAREKSRDEARTERVTWSLMVLMFAILRFMPDAWLVQMPKFIVPLVASVILLGSGLIQYTRRWHVGPATWIGGTLTVLMVIFNVRFDQRFDFTLFVLLIFIVILVIGVLTNEA